MSTVLKRGEDHTSKRVVAEEGSILVFFRDNLIQRGVVGITRGGVVVVVVVTVVVVVVVVVRIKKRHLSVEKVGSSQTIP